MIAQDFYGTELQRRKELAFNIALNDMLASQVGVWVRWCFCNMMYVCGGGVNIYMYAAHT